MSLCNCTSMCSCAKKPFKLQHLSCMQNKPQQQQQQHYDKASVFNEEQTLFFKCQTENKQPETPAPAVLPKHCLFNWCLALWSENKWRLCPKNTMISVILHGYLFGNQKELQFIIHSWDAGLRVGAFFPHFCMFVFWIFTHIRTSLYPRMCCLLYVRMLSVTH